MSGTPNKRLHEEIGGHSATLKFLHESKHSQEGSASHPTVGSKLTSSVMNEYRASYDTGNDGRSPKIPRTESRDADRSSSLPTYRISTSSHDSHPVTSENKFDIRESKDSSRDAKNDIRGMRTESREMNPNAKVDKDARFESKGDENKETKHEIENYPEHKSGMKTDKEVYTTDNQPSWKESKEQYRGKRYSDNTGGNVETWHASRPSAHGPADVGKEVLTTDERKSHVAVGENKFDWKAYDKIKDKDRKRKEGKHRDLGERDKEGSNRRSSDEAKETMRNEKEAEKCDRERKDLPKDKEKSKERDTKRDAWSGADKEVPQKEIMDVFGKAMDQDTSAVEHKKQKEHHSWKQTQSLKILDKEAKGGKKEKDSDIEGDKYEKSSSCYNKESDDGCVDVEGGTEKERDALSSGVQQRKRMLRPRGSPQMGDRDPQSKSCAQENEGSQGKPEASTVTYKVGECMQDLIKLWKEFESSQADKSSASFENGPTLEIRIPAEHVIATNRQVRGGQLWGTDIYTDDSDLVAVLMHTGYCRPTASPPHSAIQELRAVIRVLPPQDCYFSTLRNNVRSRAWGAAIGCSYRVESCCIIKRGGGTIDLEPCLTHTSTIEPTLAPVVVERTMTTRAAASNALRQQRFVREVTIQYNLCNEPWTKYSISAVADKGMKKPLYTSARLKKGEVLYLESHSCRYELCFSGEKIVKTATAALANPTESERSSHYSNGTNAEKGSTECDNGRIDVFRWSRCKKPLPQQLMLSIGIPLPLENLEVLEDNLDWEDIEWSQTGVWIAGKEYPLARVHFLSPN
ncbi:Histone deacetylation protein Rxt3 [Heracleum sosnowskyi]|uniref:Histone deacetylation protein Rxt3 n=1 Tax=Heracleum sosnowskyi TaxID=360622 RepID=A0AAD8HJG3_9APIA|nr:Histone deacetylation protein Rxt3 [Heracleum sosnowskyi]